MTYAQAKLLVSDIHMEQHPQPEEAKKKGIIWSHFDKIFIYLNSFSGLWFSFGVNRKTRGSTSRTSKISLQT